MSPKDEVNMREIAEHLEVLLESLVSHTHSTEIQLQKLTTENETQQDDLTKLGNIVIDGNGSPPILTRMALIEHTLEGLTEEIKESKAKIWQLLMIATPGIFALLLGVGATI